MSAQKTSELKMLLEKADTHIKQYVSAMEAENAKLQRQIAKLEVNQVSLNNRVKALEKELKKHDPSSLDLPDLGELLRKARARTESQR